MAKTDEPEERYQRAARRIQFLLDNHRLAAHEAARQLGVRKTVLQDILDGRSFPTEGMLRKIATHFRVDLDFLVGPTEIAEPPTPASSAAPPGPSRAPAAGLTSPPSPVGRASPVPPSKANVTKPVAPAETVAPKKTATVSLRTLAVRHQALIELLISKGHMTASEYRTQVEAIDDRTSTKA